MRLTDLSKTFSQHKAQCIACPVARNTASRGWHTSLLVMVTVLVFALQTVLPPTAEARKRPSLVRDAEIEALLRDYSRPLLKAAGLSPTAIRFYIVNDPSFNAFVSGRGMFIHTGLLLQSETPNEVIGVLAHEIGHIIGGHQARLRERMATAARLARIASFIGVGVGVAGAVAGSGDASRAGVGIAGGGANIAMRDLLRYRRDEELSADRTAARLLRETGQSPKGLIRTMRRLGGGTLGISRRRDPYLSSHPLPQQRMAMIEGAAAKNPYSNKRDSKTLQRRHELARAKIAAYTGGNRYARSLLTGSKLNQDAQDYGSAIVNYLYGSPKSAIRGLNALIKRDPTNAYFHEMKAEVLLRTGQAAASIEHFQKALKFDRTKAGYIRVNYGHALVSQGTPKRVRQAIRELRKGLASDPTAIAGHQYLAMAHSFQGNQAEALLATAEFSIRVGKKREAKQYAKRAQKSFKRGTPQWLRAEDIVLAK
ncbi:MAG: M48 family metalloprotease [Pseudomonadota bacterium]